MKDERETKRQLINELAEMRQRIAELEASETDRKQAEEATKLAYAELNQIFNTAADGMRVIDKDFNVLRINETFLTLSGVSKQEALDKKCYEVFRGPLCHTPSCPLTRILGDENRVECEVEKGRKDGIRIPCILTATPFRGHNGKLIGIVEDFKDITERKRAEEELRKYRYHLEDLVEQRTAELRTINEQLQREIAERKRAEEALRESEKRYMKLSITDSLTKLYNSRHFYNRLGSEIERATRYNHPLSLLLLDIDNFKHYNDKYGHLEGNKVLVRLGEVIRACLRQTDSAYRYGGEEFTVILPETEGKKALKIAERIRGGFETERFSPRSEQTVHMTVSIGVAQYQPEDGLSVFVNRADEAMYVAKKQGKNRIYGRY